MAIAISIHALLAESDSLTTYLETSSIISIHALLAESDFKPPVKSHRQEHFYPRSPCGERLPTLHHILKLFPFLSTLSLRRATCYRLRHSASDRHFYPRSPCGERRGWTLNINGPMEFLSTLSLRRATLLLALLTCPPRDFYPRSPCGERRRKFDQSLQQ